MSILRDVQKLITISEHLSPKLARSSLWRVAAKTALRSAVALETEWQEGDTLGAREGSQENEECLEPSQGAFTKGLNGTLEELLQRPLRGISQSTKEKTNVVPLPPSKPRSHT